MLERIKQVLRGGFISGARSALVEESLPEISYRPAALKDLNREDLIDLAKGMIRGSHVTGTTAHDLVGGVLGDLIEKGEVQVFGPDSRGRPILAYTRCGRVFVAEAAGAIVGFAAVYHHKRSHHPMYPVGQPECHLVYVDERFRRHGIAREFTRLRLQHILDHRRNFTYVESRIFPQSVEAAEMARSFGFHLVQEPGHNGCPTYIFHLPKDQVRHLINALGSAKS